MLARRKFNKTKIALAAAITLSTAVSASAATKHRAVPRHRPAVYAVRRHRPAVYNAVPSYNNPATQSDPNAPAMTGGGSLGYNQMLLID